MKKYFSFISIAIIILLAGFVAFLLYETKDEINATPETVEEIINKFHKEETIGGFAVSVFSADSILYMDGFGFADKANQIPYSTTTQQYIASVSKTLIGVSMMKLVEMGLINLDDPINKHLPFEIRNPNHSQTEITIRHLASHVSSLDYNEDVVESLYIQEDEKKESLAEFIKDYFVNGEYGEVKYTDHLPGSNYNYSNIGAGLVAFLIEYKSGMNFSKFTQKYIFEVLAIENAGWFESDVDTSNLSKYYQIDNQSLKEVSTSGVVLYPCRDLISDIQDLTLFSQALMIQSSKLLSKRSFKELHGFQLSNEVSGRDVDNVGLFFQIDRNQYGITYQLTGSTGADYCINTIVYFNPKTKLGYIYLGNTGHEAHNKFIHIRIYRTLVSLGNYFLLNKQSDDRVLENVVDLMNFKMYDYYSRVCAIF